VISRLRLERLVFVFCFCLSSASAQLTIQGGSSQGGQSPSANAAQAQYPSTVTLEFDMTPQEAAHLLASVDEVIAFDSKFTRLPVRGHVDRRITTRDELKELASKRTKDPDTEEKIQRSTAVLQKFGFVPRDFDVEKFAVESRVSQLAGYYDPKVKTMYLLNWLPPASQLPVMAHELDHALQDQNFELEKWFKTDDPEANAATGGDASEQHAARRAVVEGQATAVMIEYMLSSQGRSLTQLPLISPEVFEGLIERFSNLQTTQSAPLMMRQEMTFPYVYGLAFVHEVLLKAGKQEAFSGIFKHPPESTRQIMEPGTYLAHEKLPPLPLPALQDVLGKEYEKIESGSIGEFDCLTFIKQFGNAEQAKTISTNWRGDYFYTAKRATAGQNNGAKDAQKSDLKPEDVSLLFTSRWASPSAARVFANFYRTTVPRRYPDAKQAGPAAAQNPAQVEVWDTGEGKVTVQVEGNLVVALESFDEVSAARVRAAVLAADK
jgi:hypothetical protein